MRAKDILSVIASWRLDIGDGYKYGPCVSKLNQRIGIYQSHAMDRPHSLMIVPIAGVQPNPWTARQIINAKCKPRDRPNVGLSTHKMQPLGRTGSPEGGEGGEVREVRDEVRPRRVVMADDADGAIDSDDEPVAIDYAHQAKRIIRDEPVVQVVLTDEQATERFWQFITELNVGQQANPAAPPGKYAAIAPKYAECIGQLRGKLEYFYGMMEGRIMHIFGQKDVRDAARKRTIICNFIAMGIHAYDSILDEPDFAIFFIDNMPMGKLPIEQWM